MANIWPIAAACATGFLIALVGTGFLCRLLAGKGILDEPNQRSSHQQAKPRGGGLAVLAAIAAGIGILTFTGTPLPSGIMAVGIAAFVLALISWVDDVRGLSPLARFIPQIICVCIALYSVPVSDLPLLSALPGWLQFILLALAWLWFINLYNFMDGIDGITGTETIIITIGIAFVGMFNPNLIGLQGPALVIAAAAAGFLVWNWAPAKIFMGDVGSVPLGFVLGWLLIDMAGTGYLTAALILPGYYLIDATITMLSRLRRGEKIWQAHREHAYQHAVRNGLSHAGVSLRVGMTGCLLIGLAIASTTYPWQAGGAACIAVVLFWRYLRHVTP